MLDKDPDQMKTDPKHWLYSGFWHDFLKDPIRRFECIFRVNFAAIESLKNVNERFFRISK